MIEFLNVALPIILYICGIIALIILMVLGIKLIGVIDKVNRVVDNVEDKVNSLNGIFGIIDKATDNLINIGNTIVGAVSSITSKVFNKRKYVDEEGDIDE